MGHGGRTTDGFQLDTRNNFFTATMVRQSRMPREAVQTVSILEGLPRPSWINTQATWFEFTADLALSRGLDWKRPDSSHQSYSVILITSYSIMLNVMAALHSSPHLSHHPKSTATTLTLHLNRQMFQCPSSKILAIF